MNGSKKAATKIAHTVIIIFGEKAGHEIASRITGMDYLRRSRGNTMKNQANTTCICFRESRLT
jgi:hypothetical protein